MCLLNFILCEMQARLSRPGLGAPAEGGRAAQRPSGASASPVFRPSRSAVEADPEQHPFCRSGSSFIEAPGLLRCTDGPRVRRGRFHPALFATLAARKPPCREPPYGNPMISASAPECLSLLGRWRACLIPGSMTFGSVPPQRLHGPSVASSVPEFIPVKSRTVVSSCL